MCPKMEKAELNRYCGDFEIRAGPREEKILSLSASSTFTHCIAEASSKKNLAVLPLVVVTGISG